MCSSNSLTNTHSLSSFNIHSLTLTLLETLFHPYSSVSFPWKAHCCLKHSNSKQSQHLQLSVLISNSLLHLKGIYHKILKYNNFPQWTYFFLHTLCTCLSLDYHLVESWGRTACVYQLKQHWFISKYRSETWLLAFQHFCQCEERVNSANSR